MKLLLSCALILASFVQFGESYSKYGRTCKDIGCLNSEVCVMESDPCSYQRQGDCGSYPTCKKSSSSSAPSCKNYVCPPTQVCRMEGNHPRCVADHSKVGHVGYETSGIQDTAAQGNVYPNLPRGETTPRPNAPRPQYTGAGYQGGQIGSGYPGQGAGYPAQPAAGYPQQPYQGQGGYPQQGQAGYPQQGYGGYPQQGYNGYPQQGGYPNYPQNPNQGYTGYNQGGYSSYGNSPNRYGSQSSASGGLVDKLSNALKSYGLFYAIVAYFCQRIRGF